MLNMNALKSSTAVPHYDYDYDEDSLDKQLAVVNAAYDKYNAPATVDTARVRKSTAERKELSAKWGKGALLYLHTVIGQAAQAMGCYFCTDFTNPTYTYSGDSHLLAYKTGLQEQTDSEKYRRIARPAHQANRRFHFTHISYAWIFLAHNHP
jgi:hypothetical protein